MHEKKKTTLKSAFTVDGKSCRELISDRDRLDQLDAEIRRGEELIQEAERLRKQGMEIRKKAEAGRKRELTIQEAVRAFKLSDEEFVKENGTDSVITRLREGELSGKTYVVIIGDKSDKQFQVFFNAD